MGGKADATIDYSSAGSSRCSCIISRIAGMQERGCLNLDERRVFSVDGEAGCRTQRFTKSSSSLFDRQCGQRIALKALWIDSPKWVLRNHRPCYWLLQPRHRYTNYHPIEASDNPSLIRSLAWRPGCSASCAAWQVIRGLQSGSCHGLQFAVCRVECLSSVRLHARLCRCRPQDFRDIACLGRSFYRSDGQTLNLQVYFHGADSEGSVAMMVIIGGEAERTNIGAVSCKSDVSAAEVTVDRSQSQTCSPMGQHLPTSRAELHSHRNLAPGAGGRSPERSTPSPEVPFGLQSSEPSQRCGEDISRSPEAL